MVVVVVCRSKVVRLLLSVLDVVMWCWVLLLSLIVVLVVVVVVVVVGLVRVELDVVVEGNVLVVGVAVVLELLVDAGRGHVAEDHEYLWENGFPSITSLA